MLRRMKNDQLVAHRGSAPMNDYQYQLTDLGRERARRLVEHCSYFGSARPRVDAPRILGLYKAGKLKLDELITRTYPISEAPQAFADMQAGRNARGVIVFD